MSGPSGSAGGSWSAASRPPTCSLSVCTGRERITERQTDTHTPKQKETEQEDVHLYEQGEKQSLREKERGGIGG